MRYFLALCLTALSFRAYAADGVPFLADLEAARVWAAQSAPDAAAAKNPLKSLAALQVELASCSQADACRREGHAAVTELARALGRDAEAAEPVLDRLLSEADAFADSKAAQSARRLSNARATVKAISLASLGIRYPEPDDANPMVTDRAYQPGPGAGSGESAQAQPDSESQVHWEAEVFGGGNVNQPNQIQLQQIAQSGGYGGNTSGLVVGTPGPDHANGASVASRPPYYAARLERWDGDSAWELEGINVDNLTQPAPGNGADNDILRGYDHFLINRAYDALGFIWRVGAGMVITHPEPTPAQLAVFNSGSYYVSGVGTQASVAKRLFFTDHAFATIEGKVTTDGPQFSNPNNSVVPPTVSADGVVGIGFKF